MLGCLFPVAAAVWAAPLIELEAVHPTSHLWTVFINVPTPPDWLLEGLAADNSPLTVLSLKGLTGTQMSSVRSSPTLGTLYGEEMREFLSREYGNRLSDEVLTLALATYKTTAREETQEALEYENGVPIPDLPAVERVAPSSRAGDEGEAGGTRLGILNFLLAIGVLSVLALKVRQ